MVLGSQPRRSGIDFGLSGPIPKDIIFLLAATFGSYTLGAFASTRGLMDLLRLTPALWQNGHVWQIVTYPFITPYGGAFGLILSLWMILAFGKQVFFFVGRKAFWRHLFVTTISGAAVAVLVRMVLVALGWATPGVVPFSLMQGATMLLAFLFTGFAALYANATIHLMFVLPIKAVYFVPIEIFLAFLGFLAYQDLAGFLGLTAAIGVSYFVFSGRSPKRTLHELKLRLQRKIYERRLRKLRAQGTKGGSKGGGPKGGNGEGGGVVQGPWVN